VSCLSGKRHISAIVLSVVLVIAVFSGVGLLSAPEGNTLQGSCVGRMSIPPIKPFTHNKAARMSIPPLVPFGSVEVLSM
jgi:hypothetical protein